MTVPESAPFFGLVRTHSAVVLMDSAMVDVDGVFWSLFLPLAGMGSGDAGRGLALPEDAVECWRMRGTGVCGLVGSGGGGSWRMRSRKWDWRTPPRCFALRTRVARSGLLAVPGERYMDRRRV